MQHFHSFNEDEDGWEKVNDDLYFHPTKLVVSHHVDGKKFLIQPSEINIHDDSAEVDFKLSNGIYMTRVALSENVLFAAEQTDLQAQVRL